MDPSSVFPTGGELSESAVVGPTPKPVKIGPRRRVTVVVQLRHRATSTNHLGEDTPKGVLELETLAAYFDGMSAPGLQVALEQRVCRESFGERHGAAVLDHS